MVGCWNMFMVFKIGSSITSQIYIDTATQGLSLDSLTLGAGGLGILYIICQVHIALLYVRSFIHELGQYLQINIKNVCKYFIFK